MAAYNAEDTVEASINSVLNQTFKDFEFLICDDRSTDKTYEKIKSIAALDSRIIIFRNKSNIGLTKTLNYLIDNSNFEIIARQDADDISVLSRFEKQVKYLSDNKYDFVTSRAIKMQNNLKIPGITHYLPSKILVNFKNPFIHGTLLIKKSSLLKIGKYDESFYYSQDYKLFYDMIKKGYKYKKLITPLYKLNTIYNISSNYSKEQKYYAECVRKKRLPNLIF